MVKHRYGPTHREITPRVAVALSEDADSALGVAADVDVDVDADEAQQVQQGTMQTLRSVLQYYKFEQRVVSRLHEPGKVEYAVLLDDLSKWKCVVQQSMSTVARGDLMEG